MKTAEAASRQKQEALWKETENKRFLKELCFCQVAKIKCQVLICAPPPGLRSHLILNSAADLQSTPSSKPVEVTNNTGGLESLLFVDVLGLNIIENLYCLA